MNKDARLQELNDLILTASNKFIRKSKNILSKIRKKLKTKKILSHTLFIFILQRNLKSSTTMNYLFRREEWDEILVLLRLLLERIALVFHSLRYSLDVEEIENLQGSKCIKELKKHFDGIARIYGGFSEVAHAKPIPSIYFWIYSLHRPKNRKSKELEVLFRLFYCFLLEINFAIIKLIAKEYIKINSNWVIKENIWKYVPIHNNKPDAMISVQLSYIYGKFFQKIKL